MLYRALELDAAETAVLGMIRGQWQRLRWALQNKPLPWTGFLRRSAFARGIRGSNSIEGFEVSDDDAVAAVEGDAPFHASKEEPSWRAVVDYREAMTHAIQQGADPDASIDVTLLRGLHYMMLRSNPLKHPGSWRPGAIQVFDERIETVVYDAPPRDAVPQLMEELGAMCRNTQGESNLITASMAHLNLAMIHPFSDGNGRMARCLQTLILAKAGVLDPVFCSIEEWLGKKNNTNEYYDVLSEVGRGSWQPQNADCKPWVRFVLKAHYQQALTFERRRQELSLIWDEIESRLKEIGFHDRAAAPLVEAAFGRSLRNSRYRYLTDVKQLTASRDLKSLVDNGLLIHFGHKKGSYYKASDELTNIRKKHRLPKEVPNPFDEIDESSSAELRQPS